MSLTSERSAVESARNILASRTWPLRASERERIAADLVLVLERYDAAIAKAAEKDRGLT